MATRRGSRKSSKSGEMDLLKIARWAFLVGLVLAVVIAFIPQTAPEAVSQWSFYVLVVLGLVAGFVHIREEDEHHFMLVAIGLFLFRSLLSGVPAIGTPLTDVLGVVSFYLGLAVIAVAVRNMIMWFRS